jgi:hypothetical protein
MNIIKCVYTASVEGEYFSACSKEMGHNQLRGLKLCFLLVIEQHKFNGKALMGEGMYMSSPSGE